MSDYTKGLHKSGRRWFLFVYLFIYLFPVATSIYFKAWPTWQQFFAAAIGVVPIYWAVGIVEAFSYMPMLGPGGSYLGFITGNMSNMKVPVAINAMESAGVQQGSEEGDVISTIAIAVSSLVTLAVIIVFMVLMVPLTPVFSSEALKPAFENVVPALFGGLMVAFMSRTPKVAVPVILITAALFIAVPALKGIYPLILPVIAVAAIAYSRMLYKKGKI
jgi:hypothetical protein